MTADPLRCIRSAVPTAVLATLATLTGPAPAQGRTAPSTLPEPVALPLGFEPAPGAATGYLARGAGYGIAVDGERVELRLLRSDGGTDRVTLRCVAGRAAPVRGEDPLPGRSHYLLGSEPARWRTGVEHYRRVRRPGVYPGIDQVLYGTGRRLEYDFVVAPGGRVEDIRVEFGGVTAVKPCRDGALALLVGGGELRQEAPVAYQTIRGSRRPVQVAYRLHRDGSVGFRLGDYDRNRTLVIDPVVTYATYFGGTGLDAIFDVAVDGAGDTYVTGYTASTNLPVKGGTQTGLKGTYDVFVARLSSAGALVYSTYLGGSGGLSDYEMGLAIAVDPAGNACITGKTNAADFPVVNGAQRTPGGNYDAFVAKLNPAGSGLVYSTYLGGSGAENSWATQGNILYGGDITVDSAGEVFVTGTTASADFPVKNPLQATLKGTEDAFVARFDASGALVFSTYLGGSSQEQGFAIELGGPGEILVAGSSVSADFPTTSGTYTPDVRPIGFVTRMHAGGSALLHSMQFDAMPRSVCAGPGGAVFLAGNTSNTCMPVTFGAMQITRGTQGRHRGGLDAFFVKLDPAFRRLEYCTYYGSSSDELPSKIVADPHGNVIASLTVISGTSSGTFSSHLVKLNHDGTALCFDHRIATGGTSSAAVALAQNGDIVLVGNSSSTVIPTTPGAFQPALAGNSDGFLVRLQDQATGLVALDLGTPKLTRGRSSRGTVTLDGHAGTAPVLVALQAQPAGAVTIPSTVVILPGASSANFPILTSVRGALGSVKITATLGAVTKDRDLMVWAGPSYTVRFLGHLDGQDRKVYAYGLNDRSESTGTARTPSISFDFYVHSDAGGMQSLGLGSGSAINDLGQIAGGTGRSAFVFDRTSGMTLLPLPGGSTWGEALALNNRGEVVGWYSDNFGNNAFLWDRTRGSIPLGSLGGGSSTAYAINDAGQVAGEAYLPNGMKHAFRYTRTGGMQSLGVLPGHDYSTAYGINGAGDVVGISSQLYTTAPHAFLHKDGIGMKDLGVLSGDSHSLAFAVDDQERVVGFSAQRGAVNKRAFLYTAAAGMQELAALIEAEEAFAWDLQDARAINERGQIVGNGTFRGNRCSFSGYRLDPVNFASYDQGCAGTDGRTPVLSGTGLPAPGEKVRIAVSKGRPGTRGIVLLGTAPAKVPLPGGCPLLVGGTVLDLGIPVVLDGQGRYGIDTTVPASATPGTIYLQMMLADPNAPNGGFTVTNGLRVQIL